MKSIIITGGPAVGKTQFARLFCQGRNALEISTNFDPRDIPDSNIEVIIMYEISTKEDMAKFKEMASKTEYTFRPRYAQVNKTIAVGHITIIGVVQDRRLINEMGVRHSHIFHLTS